MKYELLLRGGCTPNIGSKLGLADADIEIIVFPADDMSFNDKYPT